MHKKLILCFIICIFSLNLSSVLAQNTIEVGETIEGDETQAQWELFLEAGQLVKINLSSDNDPMLSLYSENGDLLMENDDISFPSNRNSQIIFTAEDTGVYIVGVKSFGSDTPNGAYTLGITELEIKERLVQGNLSYDVAQIVTPNGAEIIEFNVQGEEGDVINISATSEFGEDTRLVLYDAEDNIIATADDTRAGKDAYIVRLKLPQSDTYRLDVSSGNGQPLFSPVKVHLERSQELLLNDGAQTVSLGNTMTQDVMVLNAKVSQRYLVTVSLATETASTLFIDIVGSDGGFSGKRVSGSGVEELSFVFSADSTGQIQFVLSFFSFDETDMDFTVSAEIISD